MSRIDDRMFIFLAAGMPDHPKVEPLSDGAFRLLITMWCYSRLQRTDGVIRRAVWLKRGTAKTRKELLTERLVEEIAGGDFYMHDWLDHQPSVEELESTRQGKSSGGTHGNHVRWHEKKGRRADDCKWCADNPPDDAPHPPDETAEASHMRSDMRSDDDSHSDRSPSHSNMYINPPNPRRAGGCDACRRNPKRQCRSCRTNPRALAEAAAARARKRPDWCGTCVETTRKLEDDDGIPLGNCPTCHPLSVGAVVVPLHPDREATG